jgi:hypothetical protein
MCATVHLVFPLLSLWQDPTLVGWLGVLVGIATAIVPLLVAAFSFRQQQTHKEITWRVRDDMPVLTDEQITDHITVLLNTQPVMDLRLVTVGVWNSGNVPIRVSDYVHPLILTFPGRSIQYADLQKWTPHDLLTEEEAQMFLKENALLRQKHPEAVKLPCLHLNSTKATGTQHAYTLRILLTGPEGPAHLDGMLDEGKVLKFRPQTPPSQATSIGLLVANCLAFVVAAALIISLILDPTHLPALVFMLSAALLTTVVAVVNLAITLPKVKSRRGK